jgi:cytoplasmic iron level regulating protein YaaA (DUF328/UPF0246 family)
MLALISPAKKLDFDSTIENKNCSQPYFIDETKELVDVAKSLSKGRLQSLMGISDKLADLNYARYQSFSLPFGLDNARQAAYAFRGDTYTGLDADSLSEEDLEYAQDHLRILSGLYGLLRPLDLMQPYRLEMGTRLANPRGEDLYDFWGELISKACNDSVSNHKDNTIISLASNEYIKSVKPELLKGKLITCHFKEMKNGAPKVIGLFAKKARGMMARYMIQNRIDVPECLKSFDMDGYQFVPDLSSDTDFVFIRNREIPGI